MSGKEHFSDISHNPTMKSILVASVVLRKYKIVNNSGPFRVQKLDIKQEYFLAGSEMPETSSL